MLVELRKDIFSMVSEALEFSTYACHNYNSNACDSQGHHTFSNPNPHDPSNPCSPCGPIGEDELLAQYIAMVSPFTTELDDQLKIIHHQVHVIPITSRVTFPQLSNIGLSKDKKAAITHMQDSFKLFQMTLQIVACMAHHFPNTKSDIKDIATVALIGMCTLLHTCNETWMVKALLVEVLPMFCALEGSLVLAQDCDCFFSALKFAALKQQASKPSAKPNGKWKGSLSQLSSSSSSSSSSFPKLKGKKPYYNKSSTSSGHGAGSSASQD
ncbi:uncharacterized protein ACA1_195730 [Acanthamoeba castellanii str. Neff]|uniref:Uncharacterized protein n=1 Tax=Acanthamoeba castellanii (strain ATCC 30010 / Neff) TaxID=1257118 RepID=L8HH34_ACACF|nr:uncharacterized protein ACA1_195730 [Acanthamoeba castellanii str. Neff]ELR23751.1 hypothetical protein ACA1_195730 [Acanthamoeba castellanii str. Neff]